MNKAQHLITLLRNIVKLLKDNYDAVNEAWMKKSLEAGERYFATHQINHMLSR